jgi:hypothetical protein
VAEKDGIGAILCQVRYFHREELMPSRPDEELYRDIRVKQRRWKDEERPVVRERNRIRSEQRDLW